MHITVVQAGNMTRIRLVVEECTAGSMRYVWISMAWAGQHRYVAHAVGFYYSSCQDERCDGAAVSQLGENSSCAWRRGVTGAVRTCFVLMKTSEVSMGAFERVRSVSMRRSSSCMNLVLCHGRPRDHSAETACGVLE